MEAIKRWAGRGQNVLAIGRKPDIDEAAHFDKFNLVAELQLDSLKIVAV